MSKARDLASFLNTAAFEQGSQDHLAPDTSPTFEGDPQAPTAPPGDNDTSIATTAFVKAAIASAVSGLGGVADRKVFDVSGTWNKPAKGTLAFIECWGAGGSGGRTNTTNATGAPRAPGGAGGMYAPRWVLLSALPSSVSVTVGAGGASISSGTAGNPGGDTSFGSFLTAYGGGGGTGAKSTDVLASAGGTWKGAATGEVGIAPGDFFAGASGHTSASEAEGAICGGGAGGCVSYSGSGFITEAGGVSKIGGSGGASANGSDNAVAGSVPGGGGGGAVMGASGKGGDGRCIVTVF